MNRSSTILFVTLALTTGLAGFTPVAHAQFYDTFGTSYATQAEATAADAKISASATEANAAAAKSTTDLKETPDESYNYVMQKILTLFAWLVGVAALTLEYAVFYTVFSMGTFVKNLTAIGLTWQILRDVGNIMLIFGFLAVGISIILNTERLGYGKKMLPMLLVAAVFMNFSLFFAEAIIDTGNLFASQFYTQINGGVAPTALSLASLNTKNEGISNKIMSQLGLQVIYGKAIEPDRAKEIFRGANPWLIGFMGILLFIVTAFVLFSLAFILIARFVILIFLIILAPVGFAGLAIPQLASTAKKWWDSLFKQTLTAPVLLLMLYVALRVITDVQFLRGFDAGQNADWFGTTNSNLSGFGAIFLTFLVAMGLLILVTIIAKNLSAFGAGWATKTAGTLSFGATAWGMRSTFGVGSQAASQWIRRTRFGTTKLGRVAATTFDKGAKGSFDIRGVAAGGGLKGIGVNAGDAQKGGYRAQEEKSIKSYEDYAKSLTGQEATKAQEKALAEAEANRRGAEAGKLSINEHKEAVRKVEEHKGEIARLKEQLRKDPYLQADQTHMQKLSEAEQNLSRNEAKVAAALPEATRAAEAIKAAQDAERKIREEIETTTSAKGAQKAYGENLRDSVPIVRWAMSGPGGATAAKKIIKDATTKKSGKEKVFDLVKEAIEEENKEKAPKAEEKEGEGKPDAKGH